MKKLIFLFAISTAIFAGCTSATPLEVSGTILPLDNLTYSWEDINIKGGDVEKGFHFRNDSEEPLILQGAQTSCMCTTAYIELPNGEISPTFGMHKNADWNTTIQPGEEFEVEIIFDPIAHGPKATGPVDRRVSLFSSGDKTIEISVTANVLAEEEYLEKYKDSPFSFEEMEHDFGVVKQSSGINSYDFEFAYLGKDPITVTATPTSCACTEAEISQKNFKKGDTGILTVHFDPNLHEEPEGKFFKTISILTDPALEKQPEVKIWAEMNLDLGEEAYKQKQHTE